MTLDQWMGLVRQLLPTLATLLTTVGLINASQQADFVSVGMTVVGAVGSVVGFVLAYKANSKESIIASATQMEEVDSKKLAAAITDPNLKDVAVKGAE